MVVQDLNELRSVEELLAYQKEVKARKVELHEEYRGLPFPEEQRNEFASLDETDKEIELRVGELNERTRVIEAAARADRVEKPSFQTRGANAVMGDDIYDLSTVRTSIMNPGETSQVLRDRAMRSVESAQFPQHVSREAAQGHVANLLDTIDGEGEGKVAGELARRILVTGSPTYKRAFGKTVAGKPLTSEEQRALSIGTGSAGGFSVVYTLDPTIVPTSNSSVNPFRALARVENIAGTNEWKAVTSGAITAAYAAEATEASDNSQTLAQPDIIVEKAQAFVPFSIELGQDWGALQSEMASLLQDAKDDLEATKFAVGAGHGSFEPKGIITGATATTTAGGTAAFAIADLYKLLEALPPRFRPRAQWAMNLFIIDKVRQFDTAGGSGVWIDGSATPDLRGLGPQADAGMSGTVTSSAIPRLIGRNVYESTAMSGALTTGQKIAVIGDWRYFVIVDRVGMDVEILPQLLGANRRPTGQRGLYAYWRNSSDVLSTAAFQVLVTG